MGDKPEPISACTKIKTVKFDCVWEIENASRCMERQLRSPIFTEKVDGGLLQWRLILEATGVHDCGNQKYLICEANNFYLDVEFTNMTNEKWIMSGSMSVLPDCNARSYDLNPCVRNGKTSVYCKELDRRYGVPLKRFPDKKLKINVTLETSEDTLKPAPMINEECSSSTLQSHMGALLDSTKYSDVSFVLGNTTLLAHKGILTARSPVFEAMFRNDMQETKQGRVVISDIDAKTFKVLLRFIYTGKVDNPDTTDFDLLLPAADKYGLEDLKAYCAQMLCKGLTVKSVPKFLVLADLHRADGLKANITAFVRGHPEVVETEDWLAAMSSYPKLVNEIMRLVISSK